MAFYPHGQPLTGTFRPLDRGYAVNQYSHHDQQANSMAGAIPAPHPAYGYADQYHRQSYGDVSPAPTATMDHGGVWQPPQAPRLSAAAARAARQHMMGVGYMPADYAQPHGATAWYVQALTVPQPYQQPRTHQQLEQQLLVQHHLAKAHERQNGASMYQPAFGPSAFANHQQQQHHHTSRSHHRQPQNYYPPHLSYQTANQAAHHGYAEHQPRYHDNWSNNSGYHRDQRTSDRAARDWSSWQQQQSNAYRASVSHLPPQSQMYADHAHMQAHHRHSDDESRYESNAWAAHNARAAHQAQGWEHATQYAQQSYPDSHSAHRDQRYEGPYTRHHDRSYPAGQHHIDEQSAMRAHHQDIRHYDAHSQHWQQDDSRPYAAQSDARHQIHHVAAPAAPDDDDEKAIDGAADQAQPAAPSSPDSPKKSALPIAAIGAQLIWNACTALFDPELLTEAHETSDEAMDEDCDEVMSPAGASMPSSSSTPSLNTPDISPWSSTVLDRPAAAETSSSSSDDWNAFRSPFGPDRLPHMRPQAHSFTFGSNQASSSQHDLHRMAVGAERVRSAIVRHALPSMRSRQGLGQSETATVHSSSASTASSSEPGTPASLAHQSPALSSTVSAHSVKTARSPLRAGLGMSLDHRSRSESAIRARRSSSNKASPKLASSKWSGRLRDNVLAVLRLVSPDWQWSNNDDQFVSLGQTLVSASTATAFAKASHSPSQGRSGREAVTSIVTSYANEPSPAFRRFVHQVLAQTLLSPTSFLVGILSALRLLIMAQLPDGTIDPVVLELFAQPTSAAPFKLFTLGMMIANKHLDDNTFLNKTWNEVTGIPLAELNQTEAWFLKKCNYEITVPDETWIGFLHRLQSWEEKRSSRGMHRDHESSKRLLLVLDEALSPFDAIPAFQLDGDGIGDADDKAASPMDMWAKSHHHHRPGSLALLDGTDQQHCRSAPAVATLMSPRKPFAFDDSSSHRPTHLSRASLAMEKPSATLFRTNTDFASAAGGAFKDISPLLSESGKTKNGTMTGPLMPSALLNGSRALFQHGAMFAPLSTSGWSHD
ncbi:hypothetical protein NDA13_005808 [Ustilago tritici]|nr:hypothetical protein NDA13_005808 [Ustilago tritici]